MFGKFIGLVILCSLVLVGCAAQTPRLAKPTDETDAGAWLAYYQDQFKVFGNKVAPPEEGASEAQQVAYMQARDDWKRREAIGWGVAIGALVLGGLSLLSTLSSM